MLLLSLDASQDVASVCMSEELSGTRPWYVCLLSYRCSAVSRPDFAGGLRMTGEEP